MDIINLGAADGLPPVNWANVAEKLDAGSQPAPDAHNARTTWLATLNEDGSPHVTAVGALWGTEALVPDRIGGPEECSSGDCCSIAQPTRDADVVVEGEAAVGNRPGHTGGPRQGLGEPGWPAELDDTGSGITAPFNAPSQGPPPWNVYRIKPHSATVVLGTEPGGLTRFRF